MEIRNYIAGGALKIHLAGRLDAFWSGQFSQHLDQAIQQGHKHIRLNLSELHYMSSAGIQTLVKYHKELGRMDGSFGISNPSDQVRKVLSLSGLTALLTIPAPSAGEARNQTRAVAGAQFAVSYHTAETALRCEVVGAGKNSEPKQVTCWKHVLVVGAGSLAGEAEWEHFGPLYAAGGAALWLPPDAHGTPDYMVAAEAFTPELTLRTGMLCEGPLNLRAVFGSKLSVAELGDAALEILGSDMCAIVVLGNTPSGEPMLAAGIATRTPIEILGSSMQPMLTVPWPDSSFGSAIFSGGPAAEIEGDSTAAVASFFKGHLEARVPQRIFSGDDASAAAFAEGCFFAGAISSVVGLSEL
jgi:anti-anti-sigma factor